MRWTEIASDGGQGDDPGLANAPHMASWRERPGDRGTPPSRLLDRASVTEWARQACNDPNVVFLDTETTGLGKTAEIVEIAVIAGDGTVLLSTLLRPKGPIPRRSSMIHGIYEHNVRHAPEWGEIASEVYRVLDDRRVIVYNAQFDSAVVAQSCIRARMRPPLASYECAMLKYAAYAGKVAGRSGRYRWHTLEAAARQLGVNPGGHRALGDAEACRLIVQRMAATVPAP